MSETVLSEAHAADPASGLVVAESRDVLARHAKSFRFASVFLPAAVRDDAAVVYAFCRYVDDLADETPDSALAGRLLRSLDADLATGRSDDPLVERFMDVAQTSGFSIDCARELIKGVQSDMGPVVFETDADLIRYSYRVASTVGLMMCGVLGVRASWALPHAIDLGLAMQLTNICRDVQEDAARSRVYLPRERLLAAGLSPAELLTGTAPADKLAPVIRDLLGLAERYYRSSDEGLQAIPSRARFAIVVAGRLYRAIGLKLGRNGYNPLAGRTVVGLGEKLWWLAASFIHACKPGIVGLRQPHPHDATLHRHLVGLPAAHT